MTVIDLIKIREPIEPETIISLFPKLSPAEKEKLQALKVIYHTNFVFEDMDVFENAVAILNDVSPDPSKMEGSKPEWIWKALEQIRRLRPKQEFSHEVRMYIKSILTDDGVYFYPKNIGMDETLTDTIINKLNVAQFPLEEDSFENIQIIKYLTIQEYLKDED